MRQTGCPKKFVFRPNRSAQLCLGRVSDSPADQRVAAFRWDAPKAELGAPIPFIALRKEKGRIWTATKLAAGTLPELACEDACGTKRSRPGCEFTGRPRPVFIQSRTTGSVELRPKKMNRIGAPNSALGAFLIRRLIKNVAAFHLERAQG